MIISFPDNKALHGSKSESITELIDLYPTLGDLCGYTESLPDILQVKSLAPLIRDGRVYEEEHLAYTISFGGRGASVRSTDWRYTQWNQGDTLIREELYHHRSDPEEHYNLAGDKKKHDILEAMRAALVSCRKKARKK